MIKTNKITNFLIKAFLFLQPFLIHLSILLLNGELYYLIKNRTTTATATLIIVLPMLLNILLSISAVRIFSTKDSLFRTRAILLNQLYLFSMYLQLLSNNELDIWSIIHFFLSIALVFGLAFYYEKLDKLSYRLIMPYYLSVIISLITLAVALPFAILPILVFFVFFKDKTISLIKKIFEYILSMFKI